MADKNTFESVVDGDDLYEGYYNAIYNTVNKNIVTNLINQMNATETITYPHTYVDILDSDSADTKTNWTYDAANDWYEGQSTSLATLEFQNILGAKQTDSLGSKQTVLVYVDYEPTGDADTTIVSNYSFETAGAGGADVFADWTETTGTSGSWAQSTSNATQGTYSAEYSNSDETATSSSTLTQTIDCTNLTFVAVDYWIRRDSTGSNSEGNTSATLDVGGVSDSATVSSNSSNSFADVTDSGTLYVDVSSLTGNQTITIQGTTSNNGASGGTCTSVARFDNVRGYNTDGAVNQTFTVQVSPNGTTNYETVTNGELFKLASTITNIGVKITETNSEASTNVYSKIKAIGVFII